MKLAALLVAVPALARAEPTWRLDLAARGIAAVGVDAGAQPTGLVPAIGIRAEHRLGDLAIGGWLGGGLPVYVGQAEAAASVDYEHVLRDTAGARWSITAGADLGIAVLYDHVMPDTTTGSDAVMYWGPLVRSRVQLHILTPRPNGSAIGVAFGASVAASRAHYLETASGTGWRIEPGLEIALTTRL